MISIYMLQCNINELFPSNDILIKLVPWGTDGRLPLSDLDLDLGSGHTAYRRASLIDDRPLPTYQISLRSEENFFESHH